MVHTLESAFLESIKMHSMKIIPYMYAYSEEI